MTTKIETLTDVERHQLPLYTPYLGSKAIRIIDAHAAERAALTEQVAQLTSQREEAQALQGAVLKAVRARLTEALEAKGDRWLGRPGLPEREVLARSVAEYADIIVDLESRAESAEREVARLTEALVAAEERRSHANQLAVELEDEVLSLRDRAESAERDRDAARALLREWRGLYAGRLLPEVLARQTDAHLSGQPAAPSRTEAESELAALRERVAMAIQHLHTYRKHLATIGADLALEALRGD